jgi:hypothetical protein
MVNDVRVNVFPFVTAVPDERAPVAIRVLDPLVMAQWVAVPDVEIDPSVMAEIVISRPPPARSAGALMVMPALDPSMDPVPGAVVASAYEVASESVM